MAHDDRDERKSNDENEGSWWSRWSILPEQIRVDTRHAMWGGILGAVTGLAGAWLVGEASGAEARLLLETTLPSLRSFCGTVVLALGNILALMLTLLSLSSSLEAELDWTHYQRVKQVAWITTIVLIVAILVYLILNVPLAESDSSGGAKETANWSTIYYSTLGLSSLLGGALIAIVLMLYNTVRDLIPLLSPDAPGESPISRSE